MKHLITILSLTISTTFLSQNYNLKKGYIAEGYDVVAYFNNKAVEGEVKYSTEFDGVKFKFSSKENLIIFKKSPKKFVPQCGGFCAYAIATRNERKEIDPESFEIRDNKLYLFYNKWFSNKLDSWLEEDTNQLQKQAEINWQKIKNN